MLDQYLSVKEVANKLNLNYKTVVRMCKEGKIEATKPFGNRAGWRIPENALNIYLDSKRN